MDAYEAQVAGSDAEISSLARLLFELPVLPVAGPLEPDVESEIS